jgi:hypothetical protein
MVNYKEKFIFKNPRSQKSLFLNIIKMIKLLEKSITIKDYKLTITEKNLWWISNPLSQKFNLKNFNRNLLKMYNCKKLLKWTIIEKWQISNPLFQ